MGEKRVLILASVASMIDQFNMPNIELLINMGYEVHVACNFIEGNTCSNERINVLKNNLMKLSVKFHQIDFKRNVMKFSDNIKAYNQVKNLANDNKYKFIHCHSPIGGVVSRLVGKATKTKVIYTAHGFHFFKGAPLKNWIIYYPIEKWLSRYTDVLITINKEDYNRAKNKFKAKKIEYIPGVGLDVDKFQNVMVDKKAKRDEIGISEEVFIILSVGELNKNKNHEVVIRAIAKIDNPSIHYLVCGQGNLDGYLRNLSKELGIENQVNLLGFRKDIPEICKVSDLFAFPSYREGLSVALMEAMANGLPVVCSNIRGNSDLIEDGKGGYLVEPADVEGFAKYIKELISDSDIRIEFGKFNHKKIENYSIENVLCEMEKIYKLQNEGV
ncbi:glycosyl transferase family 1 [Halolactibacillus alkaliphilus]|uniref:Glycosyl transferase family 1 n=1 Tax=Halolactibacillus alkaliphilus TaxID=442899 RepID=A0A511X4G3_9BACI|nr:glycosyltransferase family 4 protein [Halolactibacillus alkaliphilus]GEN57840.1 glycosyl transferase family 1 [Halolactibacillus alkaliphilus]GGN75221.1 glycosyl transferase family 1 [Halolactibacillus alkaliphilus]